MSCLLNQEMRDGLFVMVASDLFTKAKGDEPLDLDAYIREVYNFAKISSQGNEALALDAAMLVPGFVDQTLANRPKLEEHFEKFNEDIRMEVLAKKKAFRSIDKVREVLGLTESPAEIIDAVEQDIKTEVAPEPVIESEEKQQEKAEPWKTLPFGAFYTYGPEITETGEVVKENVLNIAAIKTIRELMEKQGVSDSSQVNVPGVGPVFLKIMPAGEANKLAGRPSYTHADKGMVAVLTNSWGDPVSFDGTGKAITNGKGASWFKLYSPVPFKVNAGGTMILDLNQKVFMDHVMASPEYSTMKDWQKKKNAASFYNTVMTKYNALVRQYRDAGMTEVEAEMEALDNLTRDFEAFEWMRQYVEEKGNSVQAVITGSSKGFVINNQYNPTPLKQIFGENTFSPISVKKEELGMNLPMGGAYFYAPGISEPINIDKPSVKDMPELMNQLISLFTQPLTENGKPVDILRRNALIQQFLLAKYSNIRFVPNTKDGGFTHENGQFRVDINGVRYSFDYTESGTANRNKLAEALQKAFTTPSKGAKVPLKRENLAKEGVVPVKTLEGQVNTNNVLEDDKGDFYKINFPHVDVVGNLINGVLEMPTINNGVLTITPMPYNNFIRDNYATIAKVDANNKVVAFNPVMTFAPTLEEFTKFIPGAKVQEQVEKSQEPVEKKEPTNTAATQSNADLDELAAGFTMDKRLPQKELNSAVLEHQIKQAEIWYNNSPLKKHFPFETVFRAVNQGIGPVAQWSIHGIRLFHYYSEDGKFDASKSGDFTDLYHEAWHGFTQTFLTADQRKTLYAEARNRSGSFVDYNGYTVSFKSADVWQLEEFLAEEFREFMISGGKKMIKGSPGTRSIFKQILDFLKAIFTIHQVPAADLIQNPLSYGPIFEMYENLRVGDLSKYNFDVNNRDKSIGVLNSLQARDKNSSSQVIDLQNANMLVNSMDSIISKFATFVSKSKGDRSYVTQLMSTPENRKSVYRTVLQELIKTKDKLIKERDELSGEDPKTAYKRNILQQSINTLEWATGPNFGDIENLANNNDNKGLIAYHVLKSKYLSEQDKESLFDDSEIDEVKQNEEARGQGFDRSGNETSQYDLSSPEVKYLLRSIHRFDKNGLPVKNVIGIHELADTHVVWNKVARTLNGIMSRPDMWKALDKAAHERNAAGEVSRIIDPTLSELLDKLGSVDTQSEADTALWQKFWATFNMVSIPLIQMTVEETTREDNGVLSSSYKMTIGQANSSSRRTGTLWRNAFRTMNTDYILRDMNEATPEGKQNPTFNMNYLDVDTVIADFTDTKGKLKDAPGFLRAIGVLLSDKPVINAAVNSNVGSPAVILTRLKTLSKNNVKRVYSLDDVFKEYEDLGLASDNANLTALADLENKHSDHTSNYAQTNAEGNTQYELSLHNSMSIMVSTINSAESYQDLMAIPHMRYLDVNINPFAASSLWLNSIFEMKDALGRPLATNDPAFGRKRRDASGNLVKLNMSNLSGVQMTSESGTDGIASASADEFTKMIMDFHMTLNGKPELMRHADKGTSFSLWLQNIVGGAKTGGYVDTVTFFKTEQGDVIGYNKAADMMMNYLDAEMKRIQKLNEIKELTKKGDVVYDEHYLKEGRKFVIFEDILTPATQAALLKDKSLANVVPENLEKVRAEIIEYLDNQFNNVKEVFQKNHFIDKTLSARIKTEAAKAGYVTGPVANSFANKALTLTEDAMVRSFVVNSWIHNIESMNIVYGDIAQYNMKKEDFHKRNAGAGSTGNLLAVDNAMINYVNKKGRKYAASKGFTEKQLATDGSFQTAILKDNEIPSAYFKEIREGIAERITAKNKGLSAKELEEKIDKAVKGYTEMNEGDAQGWITFDFYRSVSIMEGKWTSKQEKMYQAICAGESISMEDTMEFFPTKKYQYWGPVENRKNENGQFVKDESGFLPTTASHKFSLFPLIPNVIKGRNLEKLHDKLMKQGIDYALFQSGSKISTLTKIDEEGNKIQDVFYSKGRKFDETSTLTPNTVYLQFLKNQLEIAPHFKGKVTFPTQMRKLIENGLMEGGVPTDFRSDLSLPERQAAWEKLTKDEKFEKSPYYNLIKRYEADIAKLTEIKKEALIKEANIQYKTIDGKRVVQIDKKLIEFIQGELSRQELGEHEIAFLKTKKGGTGLAHDLSISLSSEKLEKILNAIVVKRLVKQKFKGEGLIQVSGVGWETTLRGELTDEEKLKYGTNELPFYTRGEDGKTKAMKVKIAMQGDFRKLYELPHNDGQKIDSLERLNEMLKSEEWLNKGQHRDMVSITGPRIPTQENNSMEFAEVYEFLPKQAGNIVVLPSEIVAKSGGDFDIDKITFMFPTIKAKTNLKDVDFKMFGDFHNKTEDELKAILEKKKKDRTEEEQNIFDHIYNYYPKEVTLPMDTTSEEGLENRILKDMRDMLALKDNYASLVRPNDTDLIKYLADDLADKVMEYKPKARFRGESSNVIAGTRVFEIQYNLYKHGSNNIGKQTLGLGAVDNTYNTVFNRIGMRMNKGYTTTGGVYKDLNILLPHNRVNDESGNKVISLANLYDATGQTSISSVVAQLINGWVDIAKDAWIFNIQGNKEVSPTLLFMVQAGVPVDQAVYMVSHPLIRKYVQEQKLAKSMFAKTLGKGDKNPMFSRNSARRVMFEELFDKDTTKKLGGKAKERDEKFDQLTRDYYQSPEVKAFFNPKQVANNLYGRIENKSGMWDNVDRAIFLHFLELEEMSKVMTKVKMNTNFDTSRSATLFDAQRKSQLLADLREEGMFPSAMIDAILTESPIGSFNVQDFQVELWQDLFKLRNNPVLNTFIMDKMKDLNEFNDAKDATFGDAEKMVNELRNDLTSFIFQNSIRKFNINDKVYRGMDIKSEGKEVKSLTSLRHAVFVKDGVIYMDKAQLEKDYQALALKKYKYNVTLADGTVISVAPVKATDFETADTYYSFVFEREILRDQWKGKWDVMKERADVQAKLEMYNTSLAKEADETDAHFEARVNQIVFEEMLRDMAMDNTFNAAKMFRSRESMADQLTQIQILYPELADKYSLVGALSANVMERGSSRTANIMLNDSMIDDPEKINIFHQNLLALSDPHKIELNTESAVERQRVTDFFNRFTVYAFLQSGMNTKGMYSLIRLVPQEKFTDLMTLYIPEFSSKINNVTLERYWKKFIQVNSDRRSRSRMRDYTINNYDLNADYERSGYGQASVKDVKDMIKAALKEKATTAAPEVKFTEDPQGNMIFDAQGIGRVGATIASNKNPDVIFAINGVAQSPDGKMLDGGADKNEAALYGIKQGNVVGLPTRNTFRAGKDGQMNKADVLPDGQQPVEGANGIASTGKTQTGNQPAPINSTVINPALKQQIDSAISTLKDYQAQGKKIAFPKAGFGQYMIGADDITGELKDDKIVPIAPAAFVYLSQQLWDNFKFVNPNFDKALGFTKQANVLQANAEVTDLDVLDALSFCFKA